MIYIFLERKSEARFLAIIFYLKKIRVPSNLNRSKYLLLIVIAANKNFDMR